MKKKLQRYFAIISLIALLIAGQSVARVVNDGGGGGSGTISSGTANNIAYYTAATTIDDLATANNGVLITSGSGVPSISSTLPNAVQDLITRLGNITTNQIPTGSWDFGGATSLEIPNSATGTVVDATGEVTVDTGAGSLNFYDGTAERVLNPIQQKGITVLEPATSDAITIIHFDQATTITKVSCVNTGASPSVTYQMPHGTDRSASGTNLFSAGIVCANTTSSLEQTSFNDATLASDEQLWLTMSAASSTSTHFEVFYRYDP